MMFFGLPSDTTRANSVSYVHLSLPFCMLCFYLSFCGCVCVRVPAYVCFLGLYEGEVHGQRGDDMHVTRLLTSLRIIKLIGCKLSSHDGHTGNSFYISINLYMCCDVVPWCVVFFCCCLSNSGDVVVVCFCSGC